MRALLITDLFPPDPGGRSEKMFRHVKYLCKNGIEVDVLCPATLAAPVDYTIAKTSSRCFRVKPFFWKHLASLKWQEGFAPISAIGRSYLRTKLPGGYMRWLLPGFLRAQRLIVTRKIKVLIAVSNPLTNQLLGLVLIKAMPHLKLVAELRDPLTGYYRSRHSNYTNLFVEGLLAKYASAIIEWEDFLPNSFSDMHPEAYKKCVRITSVGFDADQYLGYDIDIPYSEELKIVYTGGYYGEKALWLFFLTTVSEMIEKGARIRFEYFGDWVAEQEEIRRDLPSPSAKWLVIYGRVSKEACIQASQKGHALLYLLDPNEENMGRVSSKIYDYFASRRPILAIVPQQSLAEKKVSTFSPDFILPMPLGWNGNSAVYQEKLRRILEKLLGAQISDTLHTYIESDIRKYCCEHGENKFAEVISGVLEE